MMTLRAAVAGLLTVSLLGASPVQADGVPTLTGFASLPAATFVPGSEPSGTLLGTAPINGVPVPFADQPVQGFSGVARNRDGSFEVLSDNGYGNISNSLDFLLRIQRIVPDFGSHSVDVVGGIALTDPVSGDEAGTLRINEFDLRTGSYTGRRWVYRLESPANAIGDFIAVDRGRFLVIERDGLQGDAALFKRIYTIDLPGRKSLLVDLLNIADPKHLGGSSDVFRFPFTTIEDVIVLDDRTIAVLNDNNFPFSSGRTPGLPDNNEFITVRLPHKI